MRAVMQTPPGRDALTRFAAFRDRHRGESIVVCGCGPSLALLQQPERFLTIGVNDVGRCFTPDYLVVVNEKRQFAAERYAHVEASQARAVFSQLDLPHPHAVRFRLGRRGGTDRAEPECLHYTSNSPYVAVNLARHLGARRIGLIGVDLDDARHPMTRQLAQIEREYGALAQALRAEGIELVNLSPTSRLASLPRWSLDAWAAQAGPAPRIFFVHYRFLSCGTVFESGLREAAQSLGLAHAHADWTDAQLPQQIERFRPDLVFVVHGRRFTQRWGERFKAWRTAVWLLDEPYEVDDTAVWSKRFDLVFVNDPATLARHVHAHFLPVAYAPALHHAAGDEAGRARRYRVGFVGGANPSRERMLAGLARRGLLDYVVGGPWRDAQLGPICLAANLPAERTAALYRDTTIVVNVFRDRHHYNRESLPGTTMNPRICEALACGALVLSEPRDALLRALPELPTFRDDAQAAALIADFLADPVACLRVQQLCAARLRDATYAERLRTVIAIASDPAFRLSGLSVSAPALAPPALPGAAPPRPPPIASALQTGCVRPFDAEWDDFGAVARVTDAAEIVIEPGTQRGPAVERGLVSRTRFDAVDLAFEACLEPGACLLAKVHQVDRLDQATNSYHLLVDERRAYLARHRHVFRQFESPRLAWVRLRLVCRDGVLSLYRDARLLHRVRDAELGGGFAFVGAQGGCVRLRGLRLVPADAAPARQAVDSDEALVLRPVAVATPRLSIVTTVYDRTECLRHCIASVRRLAFRDYEHLIVADHPPPAAMEGITALVDEANDPRIGLVNLKQRHDNWGIAPAAAGLRGARGEYLCFLSDDNGYTPDHADHLIRALDREPMLGFVYSSCRYDGRLVLSHPVPRPGRIDLGQPMFRRELFELYLGDDLPFDMMAWDWHLVDTLMRRGVRWRHVDRQSFIFRLAKYPQLMAA